MNFPDISGAWLSKKEKHTYVITQVDDRFVYCFVYRNGVTESSIGLFLPANTDGKNVYVHVKWNRDGGKLDAPVKSAVGRVVLEGKRATKIEWDDGDVYSRPKVSGMGITQEKIKKTINEFWKLCNSAHEASAFHRTMGNILTDEVMQSHHCAYAMSHLGETSYAYVCLEITRLHEPAATCGCKNLTLACVIEDGSWDPDTLWRLMSLKSRLDAFAKQLKPVRNKIIAHNDQKTIWGNKTLGEFAVGEDIEYFENLQKFLNIIYDKVFGGPCSDFSTFKSVDAMILADFLLGKREK